MYERIKKLIQITKQIFSSHDMCDKSLSTFCSRLDSQYNILISPQALDARYNKYSVEFMKEVFNDILQKHNSILSQQKSNLKLHFNRIIVNDSTSFNLPKEFSEEYKGSGGSASEAAIKIQLQYELLSGTFMCCDIERGTKNDAEQVHHVYSLRWQIELMFKIWKSIFNIHRVKKIKIERFKCFLYGRLIALLISSSIVFAMRESILEEESKEISPIKTFDKIVEYFPLLRVEFFRGELRIVKVLKNRTGG